MLDTYRDGVGLEHCAHCHAALRSATGELLIPMPNTDLENIVRALAEIATLLEAVTHVLERACGRNQEQLRRVAAAAAEAIPGDVKTDRAGLLDEEGDE
jgi:predicted LPLAT superfamily acyltransferase